MKRAVFFALLYLCLSVGAYGDVTQIGGSQVYYQKSVEDATPTGSYPATFKIYQNGEGSPAIWEEIDNVTVTVDSLTGKKYFSHLLGSINPLPTDKPMFLKNYSLEVAFNGTTSREIFVDVPYSLEAVHAMTAENASTVEGKHAADLIGPAGPKGDKGEKGDKGDPGTPASNDVVGKLTVRSATDNESITFTVTDASGNDKFTVSDHGKLSIGGVDPYSAIYTKGNSSNSSQIISHYEGTNGSKLGGGGFIAYHNNDNGSLPQKDDRLGYYLFGARNGTAPLNSAGVVGYADGDWSADGTTKNVPSYLSFQTSPAASSPLSSSRTERMRITSAGRVGIATTTPAAALHVAEGNEVVPNARGIISAQHNDGAHGAALQFRKSRGKETAPATPIENDYIGAVYGYYWNGFMYDRSAQFGFRNDGPISDLVASSGQAYKSFPTAVVFYTGSRTDVDPVQNDLKESMRIGSNGNVGIGTKTPAAKLHVVETETTTAVRGIVSEQRSNAIHAAIVEFRKSRVQSDNATPAAVQKGDYVGSIDANPYDGANYLNTASANFVIDGDVTPDSAPTAFSVYTGYKIGVQGRTERLRITSAGNVGIGTATPGQKLEVAGGVRLNTTTTTSQVPCDASTRGTFWVNQGETDSVQVCLMTATGYAWKTIVQ